MLSIVHVLLRQMHVFVYGPQAMASKHIQIDSINEYEI